LFSAPGALLSGGVLRASSEKNPEGKNKGGENLLIFSTLIYFRDLSDSPNCNTIIGIIDVNDLHFFGN